MSPRAFPTSVFAAAFVGCMTSSQAVGTEFLLLHCGSLFADIHLLESSTLIYAMGFRARTLDSSPSVSPWIHEGDTLSVCAFLRVLMTGNVGDDQMTQGA